MRRDGAGDALLRSLVELGARTERRGSVEAADEHTTVAGEPAVVRHLLGALGAGEQGRRGWYHPDEVAPKAGEAAVDVLQLRVEEPVVADVQEVRGAEDDDHLLRAALLGDRLDEIGGRRAAGERRVDTEAVDRLFDDGLAGLTHERRPGSHVVVVERVAVTEDVQRARPGRHRWLRGAAGQAHHADGDEQGEQDGRARTHGAGSFSRNTTWECARLLLKRGTYIL